MDTGKRYRGTVKTFSDRGFGFLKCPDFPRDVFFHHTALTGMTGYRTIDQGAAVEFSVEHTERGLAAANVVKVEAAPSFGDYHDADAPNYAADDEDDAWTK